MQNPIDNPIDSYNYEHEQFKPPFIKYLREFTRAFGLMVHLSIIAIGFMIIGFWFCWDADIIDLGAIIIGLGAIIFIIIIIIASVLKSRFDRNWTLEVLSTTPWYKICPDCNRLMYKRFESVGTRGGTEWVGMYCFACEKMIAHKDWENIYIEYFICPHCGGPLRVEQNLLLRNMKRKCVRCGEKYPMYA